MIPSESPSSPTIPGFMPDSAAPFAIETVRRKGSPLASRSKDSTILQASVTGRF